MSFLNVFGSLPFSLVCLVFIASSKTPRCWSTRDALSFCDCSKCPTVSVLFKMFYRVSIVQKCPAVSVIVKNVLPCLYCSKCSTVSVLFIMSCRVCDCSKCPTVTVLLKMSYRVCVVQNVLPCLVAQSLSGRAG